MKNANINVDKSDSSEKTHLEIEEFYGGLTSRGHGEPLEAAEPEGLFRSVHPSRRARINMS